MEVGIKGDYTFVVTKEMLATAVGSGTVEVFATPAMIARMEDTATRSVIGSGIHERAIINVGRFMEKVNKKKNA